MLKILVPIAAATMLVGCEAGVGFQPEMSSSRQETAQLAAYAATTDYPTNTKATWNDNWHVGAMTKGSDIRLVNYTDHPVSNANVWVNGTYVHNVATIPARGSVTVSASDFFDKNGHVMSTDSTPLNATKIELQSGNSLYSVMGPVADSH